MKKALFVALVSGLALSSAVASAAPQMGAGTTGGIVAFAGAHPALIQAGASTVAAHPAAQSAMDAAMVANPQAAATMTAVQAAGGVTPTTGAQAGARTGARTGAQGDD